MCPDRRSFIPAPAPYNLVPNIQSLSGFQLRGIHNPSKHLTMVDLCQRCQSFDIQALSDTFSPWRGYPIEDVECSAKDGCGFCKTLVAAFSDEIESTKREQNRSLAERVRVFRLHLNFERDVGSWVHFRGVREEKDLEVTTPSTIIATPGLNIDRIEATVALFPWKSENPLPGMPLSFGGLSNPDGDPPASTRTFHAAAEPSKPKASQSIIQKSMVLKNEIAANLAVDSPAAASQDVVGRYTGRETSIVSYVRRIQEWLDTCSTHLKCSKTLSGSNTIDMRNSPLPSRCIRVWRTEGRAKFRLENTAGKTGAYITLSHRWNSATERCSTLSSNLASRLEESADRSAFGILPPLFTDVLALAAELAIDYVWIDSLCIVQRDASEWGREAVRMADYYQYSTFTVFSPDATPEVGLFNPHDTDNSHPLVRLPYRDKTGHQRGNFYLYLAERDQNKQQWDAIARSELLTRGWIFQELMLSRRLVCFAGQRLFMQCKEKAPQAEGSNIKSSSIYSDLSAPDVDVPGFWAAVVENFSALHLTKPGQDRLVALRGVADEFRHAFSKRDNAAEYMAGLWNASLPGALLWEQVTGGVHQRIEHIPTW